MGCGLSRWMVGVHAAGGHPKRFDFFPVFEVCVFAPSPWRWVTLSRPSRGSLAATPCYYKEKTESSVISK
jgi:hypothetical protein